MGSSSRVWNVKVNEARDLKCIENVKLKRRIRKRGLYLCTSVSKHSTVLSDSSSKFKSDIPSALLGRIAQRLMAQHTCRSKLHHCNAKTIFRSPKDTLIPKYPCQILSFYLYFHGRTIKAGWLVETRAFIRRIRSEKVLKPS